MGLRNRIKKGYNYVKSGYKKEKKKYDSYNNAPKLGGRRVGKIMKSKKFRSFQSNANKISGNIDDYFRL